MPLQRPMPLHERVLDQMRTWPPGQTRTARRLAEQMIEVKPGVLLDQILKTLLDQGRVRRVTPRRGPDEWGLPCG